MEKSNNSKSVDITPEIALINRENINAIYNPPDFVIALVRRILDQIGRVYWNIHQEKMNSYSDFSLGNILYRAYDCDSEEYLPNLELEDDKFWWYKHSARGLHSDEVHTEHEWIEIYDRFMEEIWRVDKEHFDSIK